MLPLEHPEDIDKDFILVLFAFIHMLLICVFQLKSCVIVTLRYLTESTFSRTVPSTSTYNVFCEEIRKISVVFGWKTPYLELSSSFNVKTIPLIRPLLGSYKGGLQWVDWVLKPKINQWKNKTNLLYVWPTVLTVIRCHTLWHLIWVSTVC